jgi:hypothetical protein
LFNQIKTNLNHKKGTSSSKGFYARLATTNDQKHHVKHRNYNNPLGNIRILNTPGTQPLLDFVGVSSRAMVL